MKGINNILNSILRLLVITLLFISQHVIGYAQQPSSYPGENEPVPPTLVNLLVYIGGPILLFIIYYYFRKREKKKRISRAKASSPDKSREDKETGE